MSNLLPAEFPPIEATHHTRHSILAALADQIALPATEIAVGTLYADTIEPDILAVLERARSEDLDWPSERLLFRGLHILGGRRFPAACRPLLAFLRGPLRRVEALFGDAITETLPRILAGVFDGDEEPLRALIADSQVDPFVRDAALKALGFLAFDGRIDRARHQEFLARFDDGSFLSRDEDIMWHAWMTAVGVLGATDLAPRVRAAFADGRISPEFAREQNFDNLIAAARERPNDPARFDAEQMGYIEDVLLALERFPESEDPFTSDAGSDEPTDEELLRWAAYRQPVHNPLRHVGRNDPCPCGSGRKAKKCCLRRNEKAA